MTLDDAPSEVRAALGFYEALRRMGYLPDELFFLVALRQDRIEDGPHLFLRVEHMGRTYTLDVGRTGLADCVALTTWTAAWNAAPTPEAARVWNDWCALALDELLVADLMKHGLWPRNLN